MKHLFGPVPSRRLGNSLGIDLIPLKTCTLDCVYCECGSTTLQTCERKEYVPFHEIIKEFSAWISNGGTADYITFAGSGEPTLNSRLGDIIDFIKNICDIPVCLITNATLFHIPEVRRQAMKADIIIPSIDAAGLGVFRRINRPPEDLTLSLVLSGLKEFRKEYKGQMWLEIFLIPGMNDSDASIERLSEIASEINPDKIQINTAVRPPAESSVKVMSPDDMKIIAEKFTPKAEIIAAYCQENPNSHECSPEAILAMIERRPCSVEDIASGLSASADEVALHLDGLSDMITTEEQDGVIFYVGKEQLRN